MANDLTARVEALEQKLAVLRDELDDRIISAAHRLRDNREFIVPFWRGGVDHAGDHLFTKIARWLSAIVIGAVSIWVLIWAAASGAFKGLLS